jgi:hypothetical protein
VDAAEDEAQHTPGSSSGRVKKQQQQQQQQGQK